MSSSAIHFPANEPADLARYFVQRANADDVEGRTGALSGGVP